jgi:hypothetical protein
LRAFGGHAGRLREVEGEEGERILALHQSLDLVEGERTVSVEVRGGEGGPRERDAGVLLRVDRTAAVNVEVRHGRSYRARLRPRAGVLPPPAGQDEQEHAHGAASQ